MHSHLSLLTVWHLSVLLGAIANCTPRVLASISQEAQPVYTLSLLSYSWSPYPSLPLPLAQSLVIYNVLLACCSILIKQTQ